MSIKHIKKSEQTPNCSYPTTKIKNISCVFCRHQFYIRDLTCLKGKHIPLLSNCGHAVCPNCATIHSEDPCPLCKATIVFDDSKAEKLLPVNVYVVGLFGIAGTRPVYREEPDLTFSQSITTKMKQRSMNEETLFSLPQEHCFQCRSPAVLKCLHCNEFQCHKCSAELHSKLKSEGNNEGHFQVMLTDYGKDAIFKPKRCEFHDEVFDYYCEDCEISGCPRCMLDFHKPHNTVRQSAKNEEYMEDFHKVHEKLAETKQRIGQAQKKLTKALLFPDEVQNGETIEAAINQHFTHLHGVLQNVERRLIDKLYEHRNYTTRNLKDIQDQLKIQEEKVQAGLLVVGAVNEISSKVNLKDVIAKLETLADVPCHLVEHPLAVHEKIMFHRESSIIEMLENHCKLSLPEVAGYNLVAKDDLPTDYELEPIVIEDLTKNEPISLESSLIKSSSCQPSTSFRRSETPSLKQNGSNLVHVCYIESPSNFYVRLACHRQIVGDMEAEIGEYAEQQFTPPEDVQPTKTYAIKRQCGRWSRVRVNAINTSQGSPDTYEVFHLDFGRTENRIPKSRLRTVPEKIAEMPQTAINCSLYDIVPKDGVWGSAARKFMSDFFKLKDGRPLAVFMYIVKKTENTHLVDICKEPSTDVEGRNISIRDTLMFEGYGKFVTSQQLLRTNPQAVRRFSREDFNLNTYYDVKCCHVESPWCMFVQKAGENVVYLAGLMQEMSVAYDNIVKTQKWKIAVPEIGMPCAVEKMPSLWCRGIVSDVPAPQTVEIFLIDFGSKVTTNHKKIRYLHEKFMLTAGQAIKVSLADIEPLDGDQWSEEAIEFTKNISEKYARVVAFENIDFGYYIALYIDKVTNFAALLVGNGYAVSTGPRSSGVVEGPRDIETNEKTQKSKVRNSRTCKRKKQKKPLADNLQNGYALPLTTEMTEAIDPFRLEVKVIRAESPDVIYVADPTKEKKYREMMDQMQKFYNKYREISDNSEWKVDYPCVVYSTHDRLFCRGKIIAINSPDEAEVFLCDLAFTIKVPVNELQALKKKFWNTQYYAFKVKLFGISPCGGSSVWPSASCDELKLIIGNNQNSRFYISKVINSEENDLYVELWVEQAKIYGPLSPPVIEMNSINWMLIDAGLALPIKQYKEKMKVLAIELMKQITNKAKMQLDESYKLIEYGKLVESDGDSFSASSNSSKNSSAMSEQSLVSNVENATSWPPPDEIKDDKFIGKPSFVDNDCCIYLHSVAQSENILRSIENNLEQIYAKTKPKVRDLVWQEGDLCIAQYHGNKKWYRAQVVEVRGTGIMVEFIDYGNIELCDVGTLRKKIALTQIPRQCTKCVIHGLYPNTPTHEWKTNDLDKIHALIVDKECEIIIKNRKRDYLEVDIAMLHPTYRELVSYLVKECRMDVLVDYGEADCSEIEMTFDESVDVIIDAYINTNELILSDGAFSKEDKNNKTDNPVTEMAIENSEEDFIEEEAIESKKKRLDDDNDDDEDEKSFETIEKVQKSGGGCIEKIIVEKEDDDYDDKSIKMTISDNAESTKAEKDEKSFNIKKEVKDVEDDNLKAKEPTNFGKDDLNIKSIEEVEDLEVIDIYKGNSENDSQIYECNFEYKDENGTTIVGNFSTVPTDEQLKKMNFSIHYDDFAANNSENLTYYCGDDAILSGTLNFTHSVGDIELSHEEATERLETISLPNNQFINDDDLVASTPVDESMESASYTSYKSIVIPLDVKVVKAEVAVVGPDVSWLHLLDNGNSEFVTLHRQKYERIFENMQKHAENQPRLLKIFDKATPCCVKYSDGLWYRCSIIDHQSAAQSSDEIRVCFVDWGNHAVLRLDEVRSMREEWLEVPCLSLPCRLWGVEKSSAATSKVFVQKLWDTYGGNETPSRPVYVEIKNFHNHIYEVQLYNDKECTELVFDSLIGEDFVVQNGKEKSD